MAKKIIISKKAQSQRNKILKYWFDRLGSNDYPYKLDKSFRDTFKILSEFPEGGKKADEYRRYMVVGNYRIYYRVLEDKILISNFWDTRRNPDDLKL